MNQDLSIVNLLLNASWVVQGVVALLVGVSIASWAAIIRKIMALKKVQNLNEEFDREFWSGTSLNDLAAGATQNAKHSGPMGIEVPFGRDENQDRRRSLRRHEANGSRLRWLTGHQPPILRPRGRGLGRLVCGR